MLQATASDANPLDAYINQMRQIIQDGHSQRANRSLAQMQSEADAFLQQAANQFPNVGFAVSVVYQDKPVLTKGYGAAAWQVPGSCVDADTIFQIGSFSKSFIAVGIGMLVDAGLVQWDDPVKKHLPWLQLADKYMEEHVTLGDLMAMNSGFGPYQGDEAVFFGFDSTERATAERLKFLPPAGSLRSGHTYVNINTLLLGQVIEAVSKKPWPQFLRERVFVPLGMKRTFSSIQTAKANNVSTNIAAGHFVCGSKVKGPYQLTDDKMNLALGYQDGNLAAGSIVSTANDLAQFARFLLSNGTVDNATLLKSPEILRRMTTGKVELNEMFTVMLALAGVLPSPNNGYAVGPGWGFDVTGQVLWNRAYFDKGGNTACHQTRNGFLPDDKLGVVVMGNGQGTSTLDTAVLRSYVAGIFLDIPKQYLDAAYMDEMAALDMMTKVNQADAPKGGECGADLYDISLTSQIPDPAKWVGKYVNPQAPDYAGPLELQVLPTGDLELQYGRVNGTVRLIDNAPSPVFDNATTPYRVLLDSRGFGSAFGYLGIVNGSRAVQFTDKVLIQEA
ncbi:TPA: hypothetical protein N0F65_008508 [Lagenidium giganteum]|uniref:Beta-lactamase-related domain-containing protein n=1 Tax=Lagenidium giganteum TaxID=4803 RepID=A0AAV2Z594_9STRA|nr:TPA: hypothetical protein N0F65_008508 [Lagenidium giganteum]